MISLSDVSLFSRDTGSPILRNITWHVEPSSRWVLFGRNGSGKTRLLEIISGYIYPTSGTVVRFSEGMPGCDIRDMRVRIGYVSTPLRERMYSSEILLDVILSGMFGSAALFDSVDETVRENARALLSETGLGRRENDTFSMLSDGERQKIMMARALIREPDLLLLDEPCAGLDLGAREDLLETIEKLAARRKTGIIFVTHHVDEILPLFDNLFIIHEGCMFFQGPVREGLTDERMSRLFERRVRITRSGDRYYSRLY